MRNNAHLVNLFYSILLIILGIFGFLARFFEANDFQITALIPAFFGIILIFMTPAMKSNNRVISHVTVVLTFILGVFSLVKFLTGIGDGLMIDRKTIIFLLVIISSFSALSLYVLRFIRIKQEQGKQGQ
ncbi:MAG: hypothetical protein ACOCUL_03580 [Bacteroidota bacterium]